MRLHDYTIGARNAQICAPCFHREPCPTHVATCGSDPSADLAEAFAAPKPFGPTSAQHPELSDGFAEFEDVRLKHGAAKPQRVAEERRLSSRSPRPRVTRTRWPTGNQRNRGSRARRARVPGAGLHGGLEKLATMNPDDIVVPTYLNNGPLYWYDMNFDAAPLGRAKSRLASRTSLGC